MTNDLTHVDAAWRAPDLLENSGISDKLKLNVEDRKDTDHELSGSSSDLPATQQPGGIKTPADGEGTATFPTDDRDGILDNGNQPAKSNNEESAAGELDGHTAEQHGVKGSKGIDTGAVDRVSTESDYRITDADQRGHQHRSNLSLRAIL